ncbi:serine/threonine-protein kinase [Marinicella rhabdoformis]|uniref:serine/threonine-protein kinase n=1 Tax=Marinicella rhabdoformis TaxID=2580566 RepID=UPI0015CF9341|nr:serine/threonine-protein kinase [Marinicella rhabdoformis]
MNINKLKLANEIFQSLSFNTIEEAMENLKTFEDIDYEVLRLVKSLINNSQHSDTQFDAQIGQQYQPVMKKVWKEGDEVDGYRLIELIGLGGMSVVFKAQRNSNIAQKPVAIKLFNLPEHSSELKQKFQKEQRILTSLSHPNVIDFHHGESTEQGESYIVMELLDKGLPIDEYVKKKFMNRSRVVDLLIQAADGLNYAHQNLIIHLDVKPSNLVVNQSGHLKVLDFGIAQLINSEAHTEKGSHSQSSFIALTPAFASPEQINNESIDTSSDVFSLAAVAVFLLTGKQPFPENRLFRKCVDDESHVSELLLSRLDDKDLQNILLKALSSDRQIRYQDMSGFRQDLKLWQMKRPVSASKNTWWYRLNRFVVRRTALFVTSMLLFVTLIVGVSLLGVQNKVIQLEADKAHAVKQFMLDAFSVTDPDTAQGIDISAKELLLSATNKIEVDEAMDDPIKFELYVALALANGRLGYYPEAIKLLNAGLLIQPKNEEAISMLTAYLLASGEIEILKHLLSKTDEQRFSTPSAKSGVMRVRAVVAAQAGEYDAAFDYQARIDAFELSEHEYIRNQALLAEIHYLKGESELSIEIIESVKKSHPLPLTHVLSLGLNSDLVEFHDRLGNFKAAMALTLENIQGYKKVLGESHPGLGGAYNSLSAFQWLDGQLVESLKSSAIAEQIFRERFGDRSEGLAQSLSNAGLAYYYQNQFEPAIEKLAKATEMLADIFGKDHPETMNAKANFATILNATGQPEKALPILEDMYQIESQTLGKAHRSTLYTQQALALTLSNLGRFEEAAKEASKNVIFINKNFSDHQLMVNHSHSVLGRVLYKAGKHELAIYNNLKHIDLWTEGDENNLAQSLLLVAKSYFELKDYDASFEYFVLWTDKLKDLYQETDVKYLDAQLQVVGYALKAKRGEWAQKLLKKIADVINNNELSLPEIERKIKELSL